MGLMFGTAGAAYSDARFFTVSDAREARKERVPMPPVLWAISHSTFIIGFGAIMLVGANPPIKDAAGALIGGNNMAAVHLANAVGGNLFLGFVRQWRLRHSGSGRRSDAGGRIGGGVA